MLSSKFKTTHEITLKRSESLILWIRIIIRAHAKGGTRIIRGVQRHDAVHIDGTSGWELDVLDVLP